MHLWQQDLAVYKIIGQMSNLEIAEMCARSGANCGSLFLDLRFRELVKTLLADHPAHLDAASLAYFMHSFSQTDKLAFRGERDDGCQNFCPGILTLMRTICRHILQLHMFQCAGSPRFFRWVDQWRTRDSRESHPPGGV